MNELNPNPEEKSVMQHFIIHRSRTAEGRFIWGKYHQACSDKLMWLRLMMF